MLFLKTITSGVSQRERERNPILELCRRCTLAPIQCCRKRADGARSAQDIMEAVLEGCWGHNRAAQWGPMDDGPLMTALLAKACSVSLKGCMLAPCRRHTGATALRGRRAKSGPAAPSVDRHNALRQKITSASEAKEAEESPP